MAIARDTVVTIHYTLKDDAGKVIDSSASGEPTAYLHGHGNIAVGMQLQAQTSQGPRTVTVTQIASDMVTIDGNHPFAGKALNFEVEIAGVRDATTEELSHGHVHGAGGHHH